MEGRTWTYGEFQAWLEEEAAEKAVKSVKPPDIWPAGVEVDAKRTPWLPDDWGQGLKISLGGNKNRVFLSPEGKIFHNKRDVEKELGRTLDNTDKNVDKARAEKKKDAPPRKDWPSWLPEDWTLGTRESAGVQRPYYVSPGGQGFYNKNHVEGYILKNPSSSRKPAPSSPAPSEASPKKPRTGDLVGTDDEVEAIGEGERAEGYALRECRDGSCWLVLPDDVLSLDLAAVGEQVETAGWLCTASDERRWSFTGYPDLVLYPSGKLLVRSSKREDAGKVARQYVDSWLAVE